MSHLHIPTSQEMTIRATVIRADGRRDELGTIVGETSIRKKVATYVRIQRLNLRTRYEQLTQWLQS